MRTEPMSPEKMAAIRDRFEFWADPKGFLADSLVDDVYALIAEIERLRALWAAVARTSRDRKAEAESRRQHGEQLKAQIAEATQRAEKAEAALAKVEAEVSSLPPDAREALSIGAMDDLPGSEG